MARDTSPRRTSTQKFKSITLVTAPFRMAFPALLEPEETDNGERYKVIALFPPEATAGIEKIEDALFDVMEDRFGDKSEWPKGRNDVWPDAKFYPADDKKWNGFKEGWMALNLSSQDAPGVVGPDKEEVLNKREVYGGRWARAQITIASYDNKSKGVTAYLNHIQLLDHDEPFSGKGNASDAFDKYEVKSKGKSRDEDEDEDDRRSTRRGRTDDRDDDRPSRRPADDRDDRRSRSRDEDEAPRRRSRDDDEDEAPRSRRSREEAPEKPRGGRDEERRPSRSRDDDDAPRSRSRSRDEDEDERPSRREAPRRSRSADDEWN